MRILIYVGIEQRKSYLLYFQKGFSKKTIRQIISNEDPPLAFHKLITLSEKAVEVLPDDVKKIQALADFTVSQRGYASERLA